MTTTDFAFIQSSRSCAVDELHAHTAIYTSAHVVSDLLRRAGWPGSHGTLMDPSAGDGAFLVEALSQLDLPPSMLSATTRLLGWEIHPAAVADAHERITSHLIARGCDADSSRAAARRMVVEADFLADELPDLTVRFMVGNPPYLRFANIPPLLRDVYTARLPRYAVGDMQHAFLDRCRRMLAPEGVLGFVTSDRWLFNAGAAELRERLGSSLGIAHLARLDPSTSFYRPKVRRRGAPPRIHPVEIHLTAGASTRRLTREPICPDGDHPDDASETTLADIADVRIAPWLGPLGIFVVDSSVAAAMPEADWIPAVDTDDISPDDTLRPATRMALRTTPALLPGSPSVAWHLWQQRDRMPKREGNRPWWIPPESITLALDQEFLLVPRIAKRLRAVPVPAGVLPINHNLSVVRRTDAMSLTDLRALLTSERSQAFIQRHAPRLENGYLSITTSLLRRLPV